MVVDTRQWQRRERKSLVHWHTEMAKETNFAIGAKRNAAKVKHVIFWSYAGGERA